MNEQEYRRNILANKAIKILKEIMNEYKKDGVIAASIHVEFNNSEVHGFNYKHKLINLKN